VAARREYRGQVRQSPNPACSVANRYLQALARQDWGDVTACLAADVLRRGPFGDDVEGITDYVSFLRRTMPSLPGYRMDIDRATDLGDARAMVELRETIELDHGPLVTHECLVFHVGTEGLLDEIAVYIRQSPDGRVEAKKEADHDT
jgi:hypothetical protein